MHLADRDLWLDELWTMELTTGRGSAHLSIPFDQLVSPAPRTTQLIDAPPLRAVWSHMDSAAHPPLYFVALRCWASLFGSSAVALRAFSLLLMISSVIVLYDLCRLWIPHSSTFWACLLFAISIPVVEYSAEVRNYAMAMLLTLASADAMARILTRGSSPRRAVAMGLCMLGAALTHYFAIITLMSLVASSIVMARRDRSKLIALTSAVAGAVGGWSVMWGQYFLRQAQHFLSVADPTTAFLSSGGNSGYGWLALVSLPIRLLTDADPRWAIPAAIGSCLLIGLCVARPNCLARTFAWFWLIGTVGTIAAIDLIRHTTQVSYIRYSILAIPALCILIATAGESRRHRLLPITAALMCALSMPSLYSSPSPRWSALGQQIARNISADRGATIIFAAPHQPDWTVGYLYMAVTQYLPHEPMAVALIHSDTPDELLERSDLFRGSNVWLVAAGRAEPWNALVARGIVCSPIALEGPAPAMLYRIASAR